MKNSANVKLLISTELMFFCMTSKWRSWRKWRSWSVIVQLVCLRG